MILTILVAVEIPLLCSINLHTFHAQLKLMIEKRKRFVAFFLPAFVIFLGISNYSRLSGTENIRAIHIVSLLTIGMAIGVLLVNVITHFAKNKNNGDL